MYLFLIELLASKVTQKVKTLTCELVNRSSVLKTV